MAAIPRVAVYEGPALFSYGFRPFFLFGALHAGIAVPIWLAMFEGEIAIATAFSARDWHVHEMLYGYVAAVVTGFLLTAIPNWTGRLPLNGVPLFVLFSVWLAGRLAVAFSGVIGWQAALVIDGSFLVLVALAAAREIIAGSNWRNLKVVVLVSLLAAGNIVFHLEAHLAGGVDYSARAGLALIVVLITLIGGRVVPSFTRNWLARENPGRLPEPFGRFDIVIVASSAATLAAWTALPSSRLVGYALIGAGILHVVRVSRWGGERTWREPLVLILHAGYAFIPAGFLLAGLASLDLASPAAGIHAFGGAAGAMTIAVMTRASLGHTGRPLHASAMTQAIYAAVVHAACVRIAAALVPSQTTPLLCAAGLLWAVAFIGFGVSYGPMLSQPKLR